MTCECTACGEIFKSETGFDKHRVGKYTIPDTRKCLTARQMRNLKTRKGKDISMIKSKGVWVTALNPRFKPSLRDVQPSK